MTMLIAGMVLIIAGYLKLGTYIKYIPYPVVVGFTAGIGLLLISTQVKDLLGLQIDNVPAEILPKWNVYIHNFDKLSWSSVVISVFTFAAIFYTQFKKPKLPAYLISVVGATLIVAVFGLDIATIGNKFGGIPHFLPMPQVPDFDWNLFFKVMPSGLTIAFLAGIESLLSATVVDGMSGDNHNSNAELVGRALPTLPVSSSWGFPATGAHCPHRHQFQSPCIFPDCRHYAVGLSAALYAAVVSRRQIHSAGLFVGRSDYRRLEHDEC